MRNLYQIVQHKNKAKIKKISNLKILIIGLLT